MFFKKDVFQQYIALKRLIISTLGWVSYPRYKFIEHLKVSGENILKTLPEQNVLFVSNHQTYFADVAAFIHVFSSVKNGLLPTTLNPLYIFRPRTNIYFIAAKETMDAGLLTRIFSLAGAIKVQRTWREAGQEIKRDVDTSDTENIGIAIRNGWVVTFPQGTTTPFAPGRKGTAHIIKNYQPIVVPLVVDGFREAFDKKGLRILKTGVELSVRIKKPLDIDYHKDSIDDIMHKVMSAIEQVDNSSTQALSIESQGQCLLEKNS